ncbi:DNA cytosine methyltransferase [Enterococcus faecalis]|uniref:DNA cytosine methyltransferase n=1 Tax=Enterococcus faecalis TaxID=1351 RepID=UPI0003301FAF|nr:DNA cytosine methyltransferase [Enterococcus faecalis]EOJ63487.1 DNA (cytosine-5-)-methyltransferase [Enterococcus faecalis EnGen0336]MDN3135118.1 DNA cytosine methyltransferase [Enterococcus faecalis]NSU68831.1 DNA cytosine methyltransferase [Enterococcus faecalis]WGG85881.1 DNA cytosine methyltransferase [Enterococcus faecalis]WOA47868.1 DNA cytosine methyltransferase [Enterococcus faecalis]
MNLKAVDLFCGIGGLTKGITNAGIEVIAGIDIESSCKFAYEQNNEAYFINKDIKEISGNEIKKLYPKDTDVKILMGCAPCQPFSSYSYRYKDNEKTIQKMDLLDYFGQLVVEVKPDIVSMENVPQLRKEKVFANFIKTLEAEGYYVFWKIVYAPEYGVPQNRKRLVLLASKFGEIELIEALHNENSYPTVRDFIGNLPKLESGETNTLDKMHRSVKLNEKNLRRIKQSKPGGTWKDWDDDLLLACHKKESGKSYSSVYGRMEWDKPSPTITTKFFGYGNGRFGHPEQDRAISYREGALLQTFPSTYKFIEKDLDKISYSQLGIQIGNAVPVKLGEAIGKSIKRHLRGGIK